MGRLLYLDQTGAARVDRRNKHVPRDDRMNRVHSAYRLIQTASGNDDDIVNQAVRILLGNR